MGTTLHRDDYTISADPDRLDLDVIHGFLAQSYWAAEIPREVVARSVANSVALGLYHREAQVGFARVVTDKATFAYLADVFVLPAHRGLGLGKWLMEAMLAHPELQGLRRWLLATADAHGLYQPFGFTALPHPERYLTIHRPHIYRGLGTEPG